MKKKLEQVKIKKNKIKVKKKKVYDFAIFTEKSVEKNNKILT